MQMRYRKAATNRQTSPKRPEERTSENLTSLEGMDHSSMLGLRSLGEDGA